MFKNRFLLVLGVLSLLLVTMAVSRPFANTAAPDAAGANDFYQRHRNWNRNLEASDYYERHASAPGAVDLSGDFFQRHTDWASEIQNIASPLTGVSVSPDYFQRHPELRIPATTDLSDYFLRH